jgi:hypothetical protein
MQNLGRDAGINTAVPPRCDWCHGPTHDQLRILDSRTGTRYRVCHCDACGHQTWSPPLADRIFRKTTAGPAHRAR